MTERTELHVEHRLSVSAKGDQTRPGQQTPQANRAIFRAREEKPFLARHGQTVDRSGVAAEQALVVENVRVLIGVCVTVLFVIRHHLFVDVLVGFLEPFEFRGQFHRD